MQTALASPVLALYSTPRSVALVGQLCAELDLLAASCQAVEEQARLKLAEVSALGAEDCTCRTAIMYRPQGCCSKPDPIKPPTG